jgi:hypothetical protein
MNLNLGLRISEEGADPERLAVLASYLRAELLRLEVENVAALQTGAPPPGTRASEVTAAGGLLVTFGQAAGGLRSVVSVITDWLLRGGNRPGRMVRLELDGDMLELSQASSTDQERLIELFVNRHTIGS